jgi:hypothetical protein
MKLFEILCENYFDLLEGRIETLKSLYADRLSAKLKSENLDLDADEFIDKIASYDPTTKKIYVQWMLNSYLKGDIKSEDIYKSLGDLAVFDKFKNKLDIKDIYKYTPKSLYQAVKDIDPESAASKRQEKQQIKTEGADVVMKGPDCTILKLKTKEAACYYGMQTRWCTAATDAENMFDYYNSQGPLYVAMCDDGRKFQFHVESMQFMDEQDNDINVKDIRTQYPTIDNFFKNVVEPEVMKEPVGAGSYAIEVMKERWPEAEPIIMKEPHSAYTYAVYILKKRWPEAEPYIIEDPYYSYSYATDVMKKRWPEAEPSILDSNYVNRYKQHFGIQ